MSKKRKNKKQNPPVDHGVTREDPSFGLDEPSEKLNRFDGQDPNKDGNQGSSDPADGTAIESSIPNIDELKYRQMGWKGIDAEPEEEYEEDVSFGSKEPIPEDELDMTPMVDVTFLLLIFFMVTASFTLQKSLEQPHVESEDPSTNFQEQEEPENDYVQVTIDQTNTYYVTTRDQDEQEAPSENEMRALVRDGKEMAAARRMIILAHVDSLHSKVVTAWDAGVVYGMEQIEIRTTDEDF